MCLLVETSNERSPPPVSECRERHLKYLKVHPTFLYGIQEFHSCRVLFGVIDQQVVVEPKWVGLVGRGCQTRHARSERGTKLRVKLFTTQ